MAFIKKPAAPGGHRRKSKGRRIKSNSNDSKNNGNGELSKNGIKIDVNKLKVGLNKSMTTSSQIKSNKNKNNEKKTQKNKFQQKTILADIKPLNIAKHKKSKSKPPKPPQKKSSENIENANKSPPPPTSPFKKVKLRNSKSTPPAPPKKSDDESAKESELPHNDISAAVHNDIAHSNSSQKTNELISESMDDHKSHFGQSPPSYSSHPKQLSLSDLTSLSNSSNLCNDNIEDNIAHIISLRGNKFCADCNVQITKENGWASVTFGTVICVECAGQHRGIPGNLIKSFFLDDKAWKSNNKNVDFLKKIGGNENANKNVWECHMPFFHLHPKNDIFANWNNHNVKLREWFIKTKYENQSFIPLTNANDYLSPTKNMSIEKMPISPSQTGLMYFATSKNGMKWSKKPQYLVLHSFFLSIYSLNKLKKKKCDHLQTFNLISLKLVINDEEYNDNDDDDEEMSDFYMFTLCPNDHKTALLKAKCPDWDVFVEWVHKIRQSITYYNMYSKLIDIKMNSKAIDLSINAQYFEREHVFVGVGKLFGGQKSHFFVFNNKLFCFGSNPIQDNGKKSSAFIKAKQGWDVQKIDVVPDVNGLRSGYKYALLLIEPYKSIPIRFHSQENVVSFYAKLKECCNEICGSFLVDFTYEMPVIVDEDEIKKDADNLEKQSKNLSKYRSKSLKNARPPQILQILAKIESNEEKQSVDDMDNIVQSNQIMQKMKEMADALAKQEKMTKNDNVILLKLHIDEHNSMTFPVKASTKCSDIISKVIKRRSINVSKIECKLYQNETALSDEDNLYDILAKTDANNHGIFIKFLEIETKSKMLDFVSSNIVLLKLFVDAKTYITIPVKKETSSKDVISKVIKRRNINQDETECFLYFDGEQINENDDFYKMVSTNQQKIKIGFRQINDDNHENIIMAEQTPQSDADLRLQRVLSAPPPSNNVNPPQTERSLSLINVTIANTEPPTLSQTRCPSVDVENIFENPENVKKSEPGSVNEEDEEETQIESIPELESVEIGVSEWKCPTCTFCNLDSSDFCKICGFAKKDLNNMNNNNGNALLFELESKSAESVNMAMMNGNFNEMQQRLVMNYHYNGYQRIFEQLQNASALSMEQVQQLQVMANYHFQQYSMSHQLIKLQAQMNVLRPSLQQQQTLPPKHSKKASVQMIYVKLERYFLMKPQQKALLITNFSNIQSALAQFASIDIVDFELFGIDNCFRLVIPSDIPLPKRKNYWHSVIAICKQHIGMCLEHVL